jgi:GNAT superfamily N-acetyltransferase
VRIEPEKLQRPPEPGFNCEQPLQNIFLHERAWTDQNERLSTTYVYFVLDVLAAFGTVVMHSIVLGTREKPARVRYRSVGALKVAQLGVDAAYQSEGLGRTVVRDMTALAIKLSTQVGCRYVAVDARPELVAWYEQQGFVVNKVEQRAREEAAAHRGASPIPVSMRFDLREV